MSEMVERVARALYDVCSVEGVTIPWEKVRKGIRELYIEEARAAIEAMRDPSHEMMAAMFEAMFEAKYDGTTAPMMGSGFEAAIDAALQD